MEWYTSFSGWESTGFFWNDTWSSFGCRNGELKRTDKHGKDFMLRHTNNLSCQSCFTFHYTEMTALRASCFIDFCLRITESSSAFAFFLTSFWLLTTQMFLLCTVWGSAFFVLLERSKKEMAVFLFIELKQKRMISWGPLCVLFPSVLSKAVLLSAVMAKPGVATS